MTIGRRIGDLLCPPILILAFDCFDGGVQGRFVVEIESPVSLEDLVGNRLLFRQVAARRRHGGKCFFWDRIGIDVLHTAEAYVCRAQKRRLRFKCLYYAGPGTRPGHPALYSSSPGAHTRTTFHSELPHEFY